MVEGRSAEALAAFGKALREHGGDPSQIEAVAMDMSPAYVKGASQYFPQARIVFDKFHLMVLAGQALDEVRRELQRESGADLKGALWSLRGNAWNLTEERQEQRKNLCRQYTKLGRAMSLRESLQAIYASPERQVAEAELQWWCSWAARSRLNPFRTLARTIRQHWDGILAYFDTHLTSAAIEAVNGIIQLAKRMARGFKNFVYFRTVAYRRAKKRSFAKTKANRPGLFEKGIVDIRVCGRPYIRSAGEWESPLEQRQFKKHEHILKRLPRNGSPPAIGIV